MKTDKNKNKNGIVQKILKGALKHLPSIILVLIILVIAVVVMNYKTPEDKVEAVKPYSYEGDDKPVVVDNGELKMVMDPKTTQFTLEVKDTGKVWYSNPKDAANDSKALEDQKELLQSTLVMSYSVTQGLETTYNSYAFSAKNNIYEIVPGKDEIRVNYSLGNVEKEYVVPPVRTEEKFNELLSKMNKSDANLIKQYYKKYDINKLSATDDKDELLSNYPALADSVIYVLRSATKENVKKKMEKQFEEAGYTYDDYLEDKKLDNAVKTNDNPVFNVSVIYKLEGKDLVVEVPYSELQYDKTTPIYSITPLPYFGAGGAEDEGFMVVPEGGGALINFNNGKTSQSSYYTNVYGWDMCLGRDAVVHNTRAYYGVYGISEGKNSFICVLENGRSYASIQADVAGKGSSYNYVNAKYSVTQREKYNVGDIANSDIYEYVPKLPDESISQRYRFIDSGSYVDMAKDYGEYLDKEYEGYMEDQKDTDTPVAIEVVGAIDKVKQIVGIPVSTPLKLTSYKEASSMIDQLTADGVKNISVKLTGWCNGGVNQKMLSGISTVGALGSKKDLQNLINNAKEKGITVYLNGITQYAYNSNIFDGFFSYRDAAKFISKERAELHEYNPVTYGERDSTDPYYLLHTETAEKMADNLVNYAQKKEAGVSFQDLGEDLSSDFYRKKTYSREAVRTRQTEKLKEYADNKIPMMINMGNDYAIPYSSMVTGMDLRGSKYTILDEYIPFFQMAVHGKVNYTGKAINISGNEEDEVLYSAEYGAGLYFTFMNETSFATQKTLYTEYYGANYDSWKDKMLEIYNRYNKELGHTFNQKMVNHDNLSSDVSMTEYADGTKVYVNYGYSDFVTSDNVKVPARDYVVKR